MSDKESKKRSIRINADGPYTVEGGLPLRKMTMLYDRQGIPVDWKQGKDIPTEPTYHLCRCGASHNKPFCDGSHVKAGFDGRETASAASYEDAAETFPGPGLDLKDDEELCAGLQFCHRAGGEWNLIESTDDPKNRKLAQEIAGKCASGRLVVCDKKGNDLEPKLEQAIGIVEDPGKGVSGPLFLMDHIEVISSDGTSYEKRNRATLCRCGASHNKPFCDGSHIDVQFNDGDASLK